MSYSPTPTPTPTATPTPSANVLLQEFVATCQRHKFSELHHSYITDHIQVAGELTMKKEHVSRMKTYMVMLGTEKDYAPLEDYSSDEDSTGSSKEEDDEDSTVELSESSSEECMDHCTSSKRSGYLKERPPPPRSTVLFWIPQSCSTAPIWELMRRSRNRLAPHSELFYYHSQKVPNTVVVIVTNHICIQYWKDLQSL